MNKVPIRIKFALLAGALVAVAVILFASFTFANFYHEEVEVLDWDIEASGRRIADMPDLEAISKGAAEMIRYEDRATYVIFAQNGDIRDAGGELSPDLARAALGATGAITVKTPTRNWRLMAFRHERATIVVGQNMDETYDVIRDLVIAYALSLPFVVLISAVGAWWVAGRVLKPVRELSMVAEKIEAEKLTQRVPVPTANDEIQRLALVLNSMLARLGESFDQAKRFAADASHELKTPLTVIRGELEQLLRDPDLGVVHEAKLVSIQEEIVRLQRTADSLLMLARLEAGVSQMDLQTLDLSALVEDVCADAELLAAGSELHLEKEISEEVIVKADEVQMRRVLLNLFDNAVKFNVRGGCINCALIVGADGTNAVFRIGNSGTGIPADLRARLFQRFFRADASRRNDGVSAGNGLGLSLSKEIARAHGGDLRISEDRCTLTWTEFVLTLPRYVAAQTKTPSRMERM